VYSIIFKTPELAISKTHSSIYVACIRAVANAYQRNSLDVSKFPIANDENYRSHLESWGAFLPGSHVRLLGSSDKSFVVGILKLLGAGDGALGTKVINDLIRCDRERERTNGKLYPIFRSLNETPSLWSDPDNVTVQVIKWILALAFIVCDHQLHRKELIERNDDATNVDLDPLVSGQCWRNAFGDIMELDLNGLSGGPNYAHGPDPPALSENQLLSVPHRGAIGTTALSEVVMCELEELMIAIGAAKYVVLDGVLFVQGDYSLALQVGQIKGTEFQVWHVCTIEEVSMFHAAPKGFIGYIKRSRTFSSLAQRGLETEFLPNSDGDYDDFDIRSKQLVIVGALVTPACGSIVDCIPFFEPPESANGGRGEHSNLSWQKIPEHGNMDIVSVANSLTVLETAQRSPSIFVYQAATGQIVEQNLFGIVKQIVSHTETQDMDSLHLSSSATNSAPVAWYNRIISAGLYVGAPNSSAVLWATRGATLTRVFTRLKMNFRPVASDGTIGGIDLALLVETDELVRVWERPPRLPLWSEVLGSVPAVAVNRLVGPLESGPRGSLFITISGLERKAKNKLLRQADDCDLFKSSSGLLLRFFGFDEALNHAQNQMAILAASNLRWDHERIYVPAKRVGPNDSKPCKIITSTPKAITESTSSSTGRNDSSTYTPQGLGELVNGSNLRPQFLGMMLECE